MFFFFTESVQLISGMSVSLSSVFKRSLQMAEQLMQSVVVGATVIGTRKGNDWKVRETWRVWRWAEYRLRKTPSGVHYLVT